MVSRKRRRNTSLPTSRATDCDKKKDKTESKKKKEVNEDCAVAQPELSSSPSPHRETTARTSPARDEEPKFQGDPIVFSPHPPQNPLTDCFPPFVIVVYPLALNVFRSTLPSHTHIHTCTQNTQLFVFIRFFPRD